MLFIVLYLATACSLLAQAAPTYVVHEKRADLLLEEWTKGPRLDATEVVPVRIALAQSNLDKGHDILMDISDPASQSYGKHLSESEITRLFAPRRESFEAVSVWLQSTGIHVDRQFESRNKQWIKFNSTTAELERLLRTKFYIWKHKRTHDEDVSSDEYYIPQSIQKHVDYIMPGITLRSSTPAASRRTESRRTHKPKPPPPGFHGLSNCSRAMYPQCLAATYNYTFSHTAQSGNDLGLFEEGRDGIDIDNFNEFKKAYYSRIPQSYLPKVLSIDGAQKTFGQNKDVETNLDLDVAAPIVYPQGIRIFQSTDPPRPNPHIPPKKYHPPYRGLFNTFLDAIDGSYCNYTAYGITGDSKIDPQYPSKRWPHPEQCGVFKPTNVISLSYGVAEAGLPVNYMKRQCSEYMKLGMRGISLFFISQDSGVGNGYNNGYYDQICIGKKDNIFAPTYPGTCPYVTTVGGTVFRKGANILDHNKEQAALLSGGGFSNVWTPLSYQRPAIDEFFNKLGDTYKYYSTKNNKNVGANGGVYNRAGRGIPDVSAMGYWIVEHVYETADNKGGGTSAAAPLWAALFNRINGERLARNKSTVGFVNPALYGNPKMINDITHGHNHNCASFYGIGFNATKGWDAATGLGSPNYPAMLEYFLKLQ